MKATNLFKRIGATVLAAALAASVLATGAFAADDNTINIFKYSGSGTPGAAGDGTEQKIPADWKPVEGAGFTLFTLPEKTDAETPIKTTSEINFPTEGEDSWIVTDWGTSDDITWDETNAKVTVTLKKVIKNPNTTQPNSYVLDDASAKQETVTLVKAEDEVKTTAAGTAQFAGLADGIYVLVETTNPVENAKSVNSYVQLPYVHVNADGTKNDPLSEVNVYPKDDTTTENTTDKHAVATGATAMKAYLTALGVPDADQAAIIGNGDTLWAVNVDFGDLAKMYKDSANVDAGGNATEAWRTYGGYTVTDTPTGATIAGSGAYYYASMTGDAMPTYTLAAAPLNTSIVGNGWEISTDKATLSTTGYATIPNPAYAFVEGSLGKFKAGTTLTATDINFADDSVTLDATGDKIVATAAAGAGTTTNAIQTLLDNSDVAVKGALFLVSTKAAATGVVEEDAVPTNKAESKTTDPTGVTKTVDTGDKVYPGVKFSILKIDGETKAPLAGAKFNVVDVDGNVLLDDGTFGAADATNAVVLTSDAEGMAVAKYVGEIPAALKTMLDTGEMLIKETVAPTGYQVKTANINAKAEETDASTTQMPDYTVTGTVNDYKNGTVDPENPTFQLPLTGGMGTTLFTVLGVVIMGCAVFFFYRSRKKNEQ